MKKINTLFFLLMVIINPIFAEKVALLIGVGNIPNNTLHTKEDIATMTSLIGQKYDRVIFLEESNATYKNIKSTFEDLYTLKKSDTLFFYYTGHGCRAFGSVDENDSKDEFLMLSDVTFKEDNITIEGGIMLDDELNYHFSKIRAQKIILFDCCHSQSMYKSISPAGTKYSKTFETIFKLGYPKNPLYSKGKNSNYIKLSACLDHQQAEDSPKGGIFTLTLQKVLKEQGNLSFSKLIEEIKNNLHPVALEHGRSGDYIPNINAKTMNPDKFYAKDIFALAEPSKKETLESYLNSKNNLKLLIHGETDKFPLGDIPILVSTLKDSKNHLYLLEVDNNNYRQLASTTVDQCLKLGDKRECTFRDTVSSMPFGRFKIYLLSTPYPLKIEKDSYKKDFRETLRSQLKNVPFEVGKVAIYTVE